jgi:hypothetical protein
MIFCFLSSTTNYQNMSEPDCDCGRTNSQSEVSRSGSDHSKERGVLVDTWTYAQGTRQSHEEPSHESLAFLFKLNKGKNSSSGRCLFPEPGILINELRQ